MTFELLVNVLARGSLGFFAALVISFFMWRLTELTLNTSDLSLGLRFLMWASILGGAAAVPTVFAWWNTQSPRRVQLVFIGLTLGTALASAWLVNEIRGVETQYALFRGVQRLQVLSVSHMFVSMFFGAALGGNAAAAAFYIYRVLRHRES